MTWSVMKKVWVPILKVKVTVQVEVLKKRTVCSISPELLNEPFGTKLGIVVHHQRPECFVAAFDCSSHSQGLKSVGNIF